MVSVSNKIRGGRIQKTPRFSQSTRWLECPTKKAKPSKKQDSEEKRNQNHQGRKEAGYSLNGDPIHWNSRPNTLKYSQFDRLRMYPRWSWRNGNWSQTIVYTYGGKAICNPTYHMFMEWQLFSCLPLLLWSNHLNQKSYQHLWFYIHLVIQTCSFAFKSEAHFQNTRLQFHTKGTFR